jgi:hypothetical protein
MIYLRKKLVMLIVSIASVLVMTTSARAQMSGSGTLTPGSIACVGSFYSNGTSVELSGQVTNDVIANPKWSIWWSSDNVNFSRVFHTQAYGVTEDLIRTYNPELFPGYFQGCVNNNTSVTIDYIISIGPGQY